MQIFILLNKKRSVFKQHAALTKNLIHKGQQTLKNSDIIFNAFNPIHIF